MKINQRHTRLLRLLSPSQERGVAELAGVLDISEATVRRDLTQLSESGKVIRTHGGVLLRSSFLREAGFGEKAATHVDEKRRIGRAVAGAVPAGSSVFVDSGTTCLEAARVLMARGDCRIITNSIPVLVEACRSEVAVTAVGGEVRGISRALVGGTALEWLTELRSDVALIGASGLDPDSGAYTTEPLEAGVKRAAIERAGEAWLLAESAKWGEAAALRFADWSCFCRWYVDGPQSMVPAFSYSTPNPIFV